MTQPDAGSLLLGFLRKPRSLPSIEALASRKKVKPWFVVAWLSQKEREGLIIRLVSDTVTLYALNQGVVHEVPEPSIYPSWLDPRTLPISRGRTICIAGAVARVKHKA